jgi:hypothetical protein
VAWLPITSLAEYVIEFELETVRLPQCRALQVGTLIQTPLAPDADNEQVARVALLKT